MPKLRTLSGKAVCDILAQHGFVEVRRRGSHIVMQRQIEDSTITVPVPVQCRFQIIKNFAPEHYVLLSGNLPYPGVNLNLK